MGGVCARGGEGILAAKSGEALHHSWRCRTAVVWMLVNCVPISSYKTPAEAHCPWGMTDRFPRNLVLLFPLNDDMSNISNILSNILVIRGKFVI